MPKTLTRRPKSPKKAAER